MLRDYSGAEQDITIIGLEDHIEIWDTQRWEEQCRQTLTDFSSLAEDLEDI